jgi:hypothetical protein
MTPPPVDEAAGKYPSADGIGRTRLREDYPDNEQERQRHQAPKKTGIALMMMPSEEGHKDSKPPKFIFITEA